MKNIVALSGGESSAAVAIICKDLERLVLYFNDTKWEHPDLYRYLQDLSDYLGMPIIHDDDGRDVWQLAVEQKALPNNRMPFCSRILKAKRLQEYAKPGDVLYFGIGTHEVHRAARIRAIYTPMGIDTRFPLIESDIDARKFMENTGIKRPEMYKMGFEHNNCSGGCVRQGARQWRLLLREMPEIYKQREALEEVFSPYTFLKDISLKKLRFIQESQLGLFDENNWIGECIGMCGGLS